MRGRATSITSAATTMMRRNNSRSCSSKRRRRFRCWLARRNSMAANLTRRNRKRLMEWMMIGIETRSAPGSTQAECTNIPDSDVAENPESPENTLERDSNIKRAFQERFRIWNLVRIGQKMQDRQMAQFDLDSQKKKEVE